MFNRNKKKRRCLRCWGYMREIATTLWYCPSCDSEVSIRKQPVPGGMKTTL